MVTVPASDARKPRMTASSERVFIRTLHLVLSIPILGYLYGPVAQIPQAAWFTRWIAMPLVILSGFWLWLKPRVRRWLGLVPSRSRSKQRSREESAAV